MSISIPTQGGGGGGGTPGNTVVSETAAGQAATAGVATEYSRADHTHGTPPLPTPAAIGAAEGGHTHAGYDAAATVILAQDFAADTAGLSKFPSGTLSHDAANGWAVFDVTTTSQYLLLGASDMPAGRIQVTFEVVAITGEWQLGLPYSTKLIDVTATGRYTVGAYYDGSGGIKRPALKCNVLDGGTGQIKLNLAYVYLENPNVPIVWHESLNGTMLQLGRGITNPNVHITGHVAIGAEAVVGLNGARTEGYNAQVGFRSRTDTYVQPNGLWTAPGGTGRAAFGDGAWAGAWRTTADGAGAKALNVSSEAIGWHCIVCNGHVAAVGRGVTVTPDGPANCVTMLGADLYLDNAWGHRIVNPDDPNKETSNYGRLIASPGNEVITVHGPDAFDARRPTVVADTTARDAIPAGSRIWGMVVYVSGENQSYFLNAGLDDDLSDNSKWVAFGTTGDKRSLNVSGGKLRLMAGRSTGTGTPGTLSLACERTLDADPGENTKGTTYDFITLDGAEDATSATVVKLRWNGSEYRLHVGAAGSGPGGTGRALYLV